MALLAKNLWKALKGSFGDFGKYRLTKLSAALAYYTIFSIAPMLIVIITLCSLFYGRSAIEGQVYGEIKSFDGSDAALQIQDIIGKAAVAKDLTWASVISIVALVFSATGVFAEIQTSINFIWNLRANPKKGGIVKMLLNRLISFSMIISLGFIALVALLVNAVLDAITEKLLRMFPQITVYLAYIINQLVTFGSITLLFAIIFKVLPDAKVKWKDVWVGSITTALLFMIGKYGIGFYLGKSNISSTFGAAGSIVIILLWVYYSAIILYFGAAFTKSYAQVKGNHIYPNDYAVYVEHIEVENRQSLQAQKETIEKEKA